MRLRIDKMEGRKTEWQERLMKKNEREEEYKAKVQKGEETGFFDDGMVIDSLYEYNETYKEIFEQEKVNKDSEDDKTPKAVESKEADDLIVEKALKTKEDSILKLLNSEEDLLKEGEESSIEIVMT